MKNILLVAQGAGSSHETITRAAVEAGLGLRHASNSHEAFEILTDGLDDIEVVVIDTDPGSHSLSILDAISLHTTAPPMIVITSSPEAGISNMPHRHGASACISKPFTALELSALIKDVCLPEWQRTGGSCDKWGHRKSARRWCTSHRYDRLHCLSL